VFVSSLPQTQPHQHASKATHDIYCSSLLLLQHITIAGAASAKLKRSARVTRPGSTAVKAFVDA
jgi:hypothetical protein